MLLTCRGRPRATVVVFDRADNAGVTSDPVPFPFAVDVTPPTLAVASHACEAPRPLSLSPLP